MEDKISVIIPVYNVAPYLERCLDSIVQNTYRNLEIICVDDGSPDNCGAILDRYAECDDRFVVIHKENGGLSSARNSGMDAATGEYIAFIDSDDWIHPQYFEILLELLKKEDSDFSMCSFVSTTDYIEPAWIDATTLEVQKMTLADVFHGHYTRSYVWGKLYRRTLVQEYRFIENVRIAEDAAFNGAALGECDDLRACFVKVPLYYYYRRPGSLSHQLKGYNAYTLACIFEEYAQKTTKQMARRLYLIDAIKRGLIARYMMSHNPKEKKYIHECNQMLLRVLKEAWRMHNFSGKEKMQYAILVASPQVYRLFRIIDDPTLLKMEKELKKQKA